MPDYATHDEAEQAILNRSVLRAGGTTITPSAAGVIGLITRAAVGQTANLQEWQDSAGTVLSQVRSDGHFAIGHPGLSNTAMVIQPKAATHVGMTVYGFAGQTQNLQQWGNSSGTSMLSVESQGIIRLQSLATDSGTNAFLNWSGSPSNQLRPGSASAVGLVVRGAASQTANLQEWQDSAGTVKASVTNTGKIVGEAGLQSNGPLSGAAGNGHIAAFMTSASSPGLVIRGAASQTANLAEIQNSSGTFLAGFTYDGLPMYGSYSSVAPSTTTGTTNYSNIANVRGWIPVSLGGTTYKVPYYNS